MTSTNSKRSEARGFSNEESFGLFMEAVRELQLYEEEAARSQSNPTALKQHVEDALEALEQCHRTFPDDLLPRYYLGIALTMQNQVLYASELRRRQPQVPNLSTSVPARPLGLGVLPDRPWPLLDRALDCFDRNNAFGSLPELRDAA